MTGRAYLVYITAGGEEEARRIARSLVERRLAACASVVPAVHSVYWWEGRLEEAGEALVLVKTVAEALEPLERAVREMHSYSVPAISAIPIERLHEPYWRWMQEEIRPRGEGTGK
ncbi:divalent-cation tolerance protein CutA [Carboxydochorda subterranea]|uniref:Divalent-cation tolerance protein CutA n=1 Tax=Carboxydichorda subterranea TaxID=3109565 RepID=A0ABZ1BUZ2_9FIRM|nr:divalent-cation tolerance protein CutA [Limnochorda sp. L945t]WRP16478.1 divalent-cation tolerance protein CutA [Limnochorda sp. L945t]